MRQGVRAQQRPVGEPARHPMPEVPIDLGEVTPNLDAGVPDVRWRHPDWLRRAPVVVLVALVALLSLGASTGGGTGLGEPLWTRDVSWDGLSFDSGRVYVPDGSDGTSVVALDARTGHELWRRTGVERPLRIAEMDESTIAMWADDGLQFVAAATGDVLYRASSSAYPWGVTSGGLLVLAEYDGPGAPGCPPHPSSPTVGCDTVYAVPAAGGQPVWRMMLRRPLVATSIVDGRLDGFVSIRDGGQARWYDVETGVLSGTTAIAPAGVSGVVIDSHLLVINYDRDRHVLSSYTRDGDLEWRIPLPREHLTRPGWRLTVDRCDDYACVVASGSVFVIDPGTGQATFGLPEAILTEMGGGRFLAALGPAAGLRNATVELRDATSGTRIATLPKGIPIRWKDSAGRGLLAQEGSAATAIYMVEPAGTTRFLGTLPERDLSCRAEVDLLLCQGRNQVQVWRLPS